MGRQIPIVATLEDEQLMLAYLRGLSEITIFESSALTIPDLVVESFASEYAYHGQYFIWNRTFPWQPTYGEVDHPSAPAASRGRVYLKDKGVAPLLEYDRAVPGRRMAGRLYWSKYFSAPNGLAYDVEAFSHWYDQIVRWVKKVSTKQLFGSSSAYLLPGAHRMFESKASGNATPGAV